MLWGGAPVKERKVSLKPVDEEWPIPVKFKLDEEISRVGPLRVVRAHDKKNAYLIKIFNSTNVAKQYKEKFLNDVEFFRTCKDTRLTPVVDVITEPPYTYIVYEEPMGGDLERLMEQNGETFSESFVKNVASSILDTLAFLHLNDITHTYCLPKNIFFPLDPAIPGWLQHVQLSTVYCELTIDLPTATDLRDLAFMLCALMKRNLPMFNREDFAPIVLKSTRWAHLSADFIDFIEQLWVAEKSGKDPEHFLEHHWLVIVKPQALKDTGFKLDEEEEPEPFTAKHCWLLFKLNVTKTGFSGRKWKKGFGNVVSATLFLSGDESGLTGPEGFMLPLAWNLDNAEPVVTMSTKHDLTFALVNKVNRQVILWLRFDNSPDHDSFKSAITDVTDPDKVKRVIYKPQMKSKVKKEPKKIVRGKSYKGPVEETEEQKQKRFSALIRAQSLAYCLKTQTRKEAKPKQGSLAPYPSEIRTRIHPGQKWNKRTRELALVMATGVPLNYPVKDGDHWFIVDAVWFRQWFRFVSSTRRMVPPGPIDNLWMVGSKTNLPIEGLREDYDKDDGDFRRVPPQVWALFEEWYGGGPAISFVGPPAHDIKRWVVHFDGIVGNYYDNESDDESSENSEEAIVHMDALKATPDELQKLAEITNF